MLYGIDRDNNFAIRLRLFLFLYISQTSLHSLDDSRCCHLQKPLAKQSSEYATWLVSSLYSDQPP